MGRGNGFEQLTITNKGKSNTKMEVKEKFGPRVGVGSATESEAEIYLFLYPSEGVA